MDSGSPCSGPGQQPPATLPGASPPAPKAPLCRWGTRAPTPRGHTETFVDPSTIPAVPDGSVHPAPIQLPSRGLGRSTSSLRGQHHPTAWATPARSWACQCPGRWVSEWTGGRAHLVATSVHLHLPDPFPETAEPGIRPPQVQPPTPRACSPAPTPARTPYGVTCQPACPWPCVFSRSLEDMGEMRVQESLGPGSHLQHKGGSAVGSPCSGQDTGTAGQKSRLGDRICPPWGSCPAGVCPLTAKCRAQVQQVPVWGPWRSRRPHPPRLPSASQRSQLQVWEGQVPGGNWGVSPPGGRLGGSGALLCYRRVNPTEAQRGQRAGLLRAQGEGWSSRAPQGLAGPPTLTALPLHTQAHACTHGHKCARTHRRTHRSQKTHAHTCPRPAPLGSGLLVRTSFLLV